MPNYQCTLCSQKVPLNSNPKDIKIDLLIKRDLKFNIQVKGPL